MYQKLDGPATQFSVTLTSSTVVEVKAGANAMIGRQVITILPLDGKIWVYYGDGDNTPSASDVKTKGFPQFKHAKETYEASETQPIFIVADDANVDVRIAERG
jgi:hypothetical protein